MLNRSAHPQRRRGDSQWSAIVGHEGVGIVDFAGCGAVSWLGDRVLISCITACGRCDHCRTLFGSAYRRADSGPWVDTHQYAQVGPGGYFRSSFDLIHPMFRHRNQLRRWAARLLFVWLVAFGTGLANACLSSGAVTLDATSSEGSAAESAPHQESAVEKGGHDHAGTTAHERDGTPGHHSAPAKANCIEFCNRASIPVPTFKSSLDDCQGYAVLQLAVVPLMPATPAQPAAMRVPHLIGFAAPPIPIAYLRLTL